jgi:predicted transcriptional regulator
MTRKLPNLGALELETLKVLWEQGPCTVVQVGERLSKRRGVTRARIHTTLVRLLKKGYVKRKMGETLYHYQATRKRPQVMGALLTEFIHKVFDGSSANLVAHLSSVDVEPEELQEIRRIINQQPDQE